MLSFLVESSCSTLSARKLILNQSMTGLSAFRLASGAEAKKLYEDAQVMLQNVLNDKLFECRGVLAFYKASSDGDDIQLFDEDDSYLGTLHGLRQQVMSQCGAVVTGLILAE